MAGNKIYGITIDIEGKNDGLVKSLKEVDKSLGSTKSALNDVNKALKLDPKNTELLTQKQALLKKEISTTGDKLKLMKQVAEEAAKGLETGAVTQEQYAKLPAEISKPEQSLKAMTTEAERNDKALEECGSEASKLKEQMDALDKNIDKTDRALKSVNAA
ncbi:MAG: phage tail tape measure protein, partial [Clostridia bacterium]|nr:phage tail tape measure protein [Clostridia bacterium]